MKTTEPDFLQPPRGMRDFYPEDMRRRDRIFDAWRQAARAFGFLPYDACVVESLGLLERKAGEEISDQIYTFTDKKGRRLALRPEITPTLARMVAARQASLSLPLKWFTIAQCFRYERMTRGRKREHYQWNLDIIGDASVLAEIEVVAAAADALRRLGFNPADYEIRFNSRALLTELLDTLAIDPGLQPAVFTALDKRGKRPDDEIRRLLTAAGVDASAADRIFDLMSTSDLDDAAARLPGNSDAVARLRAFRRLAEPYGLADVLRFDLGVVRGLAYYTGIVFEAFDRRGQLRAIFGGGRYDNLLRDVGGIPATGVGLGFGDVVVGEFMQALEAEALPEPAGIAVGYMHEDQQPAALALAASLRAGGRAVDLALAPEKARRFFARAAKAAFREACYLGPDDLDAGAARIKDLAAREERVVALPAS